MLPLATSALVESPAQARSISLTMLEGVATSTRVIQSQDGLDLMAVEIRDERDGQRTLVILAPEAACKEIGFKVTPGDRLRARVFGPVDATATAQEVLNLSRVTRARFRTLTGIPFWTTAGEWQGGVSRSLPGTGPHGTRHRAAHPDEVAREDHGPGE